MAGAAAGAVTIVLGRDEQPLLIQPQAFHVLPDDIRNVSAQAPFNSQDDF